MSGPLEVWVCTDCLAFLANGTLGQEDPTEDQSHQDAMRAVWGDLRHLVPGDCSDDVCGFSWGRCEGCHSSLGGDRHQAFWLGEQ
jgi:hypothetical protein